MKKEFEDLILNPYNKKASLAFFLNEKNYLRITDGIYSYFVPNDMGFSFEEGTYYEHNFSFWFEQCVNLKKNPVIYDIGGNFGYYTVRLAPKSDNIYSFEPVSKTMEFLLKNIRENRLRNVLPVKVGLGQKRSQASINLYSSSGNNSLFKRALPKNHPVKLIGKEKIEIFTLDELVAGGKIKPPQVIKIDTEGGELNILKGAQETISKHRPIVLMEFSEEIFKDAGYSRSDVVKMFSDWGYKILGIADYSLDFGLWEDYQDDEVANILAFPKEDKKFEKTLMKMSQESLLNPPVNPQLSIIVPVYNVEKYLPQCLDSVLAQTLQKIEIICVNDGSTDNSLEILKEYEKRDRRIRVINKVNEGLSSARNAGLRVAKGEFIGFVDSDDWVDPEMFKKLYDKAKANNAEMAICGINIFDESTKTVNRDDPYYGLGGFKEYLDDASFSAEDTEKTLFTISVTAVDKIYKRELIERTKAIFPEGLVFEDNPFFFETYLNAKRIVILREHLYYYRVNRENAITASYGKKHFEIIEIQNEIEKAFKNAGVYKKFKEKLIEIRTYCVRDIYNKLEDDKLKKEFLKRIKKDLLAHNLSPKDLFSLDIGLRSFYSAARAITKSDPHVFDESVNAFSVSYFKKESSVIGRVLKIFIRLEKLLKALQLRVRELKFTKLTGLRELLLDVARFIKRRVMKFFYFPLKNYLAEHLEEETRKRLKYFIKLQFLKVKVRERNKKWNGPLVTVITTFFNQSDTILETVESVLSQQFTDFEYLIVNDGSKPEQRAVLDKIKDPRVKIIDQEHRGMGSPAPARNNGLSHAKGKYIMCLDGDDLLTPTYIEKMVTVLETNHNVDIVSANMIMFGAQNCDCLFGDYKPQRLLRQNLIAAMSMFRADLLKRVKGYREKFGYEDWEFWVNLVEHGAHVINIKDKLVLYRVAESSRYTEDLKKHRQNFLNIAKLHRFYRIRVFGHRLIRFFINKKATMETAYVNLGSESFSPVSKPHILYAVPWLTYGGAETLIKNITGQLKNDYEITFMTGYYSNHEFENEFKKITERIYHLPYLFPEKDDYLPFINNYIKTRNVKVLHVFHNEFLFRFVPEIRKENPDLKIIFTLFNDRVGYFKKAVELHKNVEVYTSDNSKTLESVRSIAKNAKTEVMVNGIDVQNEFNPKKYRKDQIREKLGLEKDDQVVIFIARLSEEGEKNPEFVLDLAESLSSEEKIKFLVVGNGPALPRLLNRYGHLGNTQFFGYRSDVPELIAASDVLILSSRVEGSPQVITEAMAMGKTVLAAPVGGIPDLIEDKKTGLYLDISDIGGAKKLLKEAFAQKELGKRAREKAISNFSFEKMSEDYKKFYRSLIK